jgi:hypothetical protein
MSYFFLNHQSANKRFITAEIKPAATIFQLIGFSEKVVQKQRWQQEFGSYC